MKRKTFLKRISFLTAGAALFPGVLTAKDAESVKTSDIKPSPYLWTDDEVNVAWLGHSTVLINLFGTKIITDPVLFNNIGVYIFGATFGPSRYSPPALAPDEIPEPDIVLLSHAHMDHMDYKSLKFLTDKYPYKISCITAYNTVDVLEDLKWKTTKELDWNDEFWIEDIYFKALKVQHFGWRFPWEKDRSQGFIKNGRSFNAYQIIKNNKRVIFGGDTCFHNHFLEHNFDSNDIAIMPIGAYNPWHRVHCNPEEAVIMASQHLKAKTFIPIHCKTIRQGSEPEDEPLSWMQRAAAQYRIEVGVKAIGETYTLSS